MCCYSSTKLTPVPIQLAVLAVLFFLGQACKRTPTTAEDIRIGRQAMPIAEISLMLRGGTSQTALIADVNRRHIPEKISAALELELKDKGAGPGLITALKDENNVLSENQKDAFDKRMEGLVVPTGHGLQQRFNGAIQCRSTRASTPTRFTAGQSS